MASARYGYMTASPSDAPSLKRPHAMLLAPNSSTGTPRTKSQAPQTVSTSKPSIPLAPQSPSAPPDTDNDPSIFKSQPIHDRKSTFIGYFSPTTPPLDLQRSPTIASASHRVLAYRIPPSIPLSTFNAAKKVKVSQTTLPFGGRQGTGTIVGALQTGQDDDGESYAAKKVMGVLLQEKVEGSIVMARWYGGVMLGPVRFTHIENVAREAINAWRASLLPTPPESGDGGAQGDATATGTGEKPAVEKARLIVELGERDESIASLRKLLKQKKALLEQLEGDANAIIGKDGAAATTAADASPAKKLDYASMPLERLRAHDKARDNTVAFLLKQIDAVEAQIESWTALLEMKDDEDGENDGGAKEGKGGVQATPVGVGSRR